MSVTISTKVPEELAERIEAAQEEGESTSATVRRLIRSGLEQNQNDITLPIILMWAGSVAIATQYANSSGIIGPVGIIAVAIGILLTRDDVYQKVQSLNRRYTKNQSQDTPE